MKKLTSTNQSLASMTYLWTCCEDMFHKKDMPLCRQCVDEPVWHTWAKGYPAQDKWIKSNKLTFSIVFPFFFGQFFHVFRCEKHDSERFLPQMVPFHRLCPRLPPSASSEFESSGARPSWTWKNAAHKPILWGSRGCKLTAKEFWNILFSIS